MQTIILDNCKGHKENELCQRTKRLEVEEEMAKDRKNGVLRSQDQTLITAGILCAFKNLNSKILIFVEIICNETSTNPE